MAKYKLLKSRNCYRPLVKGEVYDEDYTPEGWYENIGYNALHNPKDWVEVIDEVDIPKIKFLNYKKNE